MKRINIVGMKGYKLSGFYEGLIGIIEKSNTEGFEHLYRIKFGDGSGVLASWDDIATIAESKLTTYEELV